MRFHLDNAPEIIARQRQYEGIMTALWATLGEPDRVVRLRMGTGDDGERILQGLRVYVHAQVRPRDQYFLQAQPDGPREYVIWLQGPPRDGAPERTVPSPAMSIVAEPNPHLGKSIDELELTVRAYNGLKNANVETVQQLVGLTKRSLLRTKNMGKRSVAEIQEVLAAMGLTLAPESALRSVS